MIGPAGERTGAKPGGKKLEKTEVFSTDGRGVPELTGGGKIDQSAVIATPQLQVASWKA